MMNNNNTTTTTTIVSTILSDISSLLLHQKEQQQQQSVFLLGIAGIPGSGKSSLANRLKSSLLKESYNNDNVTILPMDGFHIPKSELPSHLIQKRGCPESFDPMGLLNLLQLLKQQSSSNTTNTTSTTTITPITITAPSFDHRIGDPIHNIQIQFNPNNPSHHHLFIVEGLYLAYDAPIWNQIHAILDCVYFLHVPKSVSRSRVMSRHVASGLCPDLESAAIRYDSNDALNADLILNNLLPCRRMFDNYSFNEI